MYSELHYLLKNDPDWLNNIMPKKINDRNSPETLEKSKKVLLEYIQAYPHCIRTEIRDAHRKEYEQCKQYDTKWFNDNMPYPIKNLQKDFNKKLHENRTQIEDYIRNHENCNISEIIRDCSKEYEWLYNNDIYWIKGSLPDSTTVSENNRRKLIEQYRDRVLNFLKSNPTFTRTQIANHMTKEYKYLEKYDREWIDCEMPKPIDLGLRNTKKSYIDWQMRDIEVLQILKNTIETNSLYTNTKFRTLSKVIVLLPVDYKAIVKYSLHKLPKSKQYINELLNS